MLIMESLFLKCELRSWLECTLNIPSLFQVRPARTLVAGISFKDKESQT